MFAVPLAGPMAGLEPTLDRRASMYSSGSNASPKRDQKVGRGHQWRAVINMLEMVCVNHACSPWDRQHRKPTCSPHSQKCLPPPSPEVAGWTFCSLFVRSACLFNHSPPKVETTGCQSDRRYAVLPRLLPQVRFKRLYLVSYPSWVRCLALSRVCSVLVAGDGGARAALAGASVALRPAGTAGTACGGRHGRRPFPRGYGSRT